MTRKKIVTTDPAGRQSVQTPASIQYVRTGGRRPAPRTAGTVRGVRSAFA